MSSIRIGIALFWSLFLGTGGVSAQCQPGWLPGQSVAGASGQVTSLASWDPDGLGPQPELLVAGGSFVTNEGNATIASWDGVRWTTLGNFNDNRVMVAGSSLYSTSGASGTIFRRWNGTAWDTLGQQFNSKVWSAIEFEGDLIVGGDFVRIGNSTIVRGLARWNGQAWVSVGTGVTGRVRALTEFRGELIAAGDFTSPGNKIAAWNGSQWRPLGGGIAGLNVVRSLAVFNDSLYACGQFASAEGRYCSNIARWDGAAWHPVQGGIGNGLVDEASSMAVFQNGLIVGGRFDTVSLLPIRGIARWDSEVWSDLAGGISAASSYSVDPHVEALTLFRGRLVAGGRFSVAGGRGASCLALWDGTAWEPLSSGIGRATEIGSSVPTTAASLLTLGGHLFANGRFEVMGGIPAPWIARWNGSTWAPISPSPPIADTVTVFGGELVAAGQFTAADDVAVSNIAAWNGTRWRSLGNSLAYPQRPTALGSFSNELIAATDRAIWAWDGNSWRALTSIGDTNAVFAIHEHGGSLFVGGSFQLINGTVGGRIARWDGTNWHQVGAGVAASSTFSSIYSIASYGGLLIVGGSFTRAGDLPAQNLASWDGTQWRQFAGGANDVVSRLRVVDGLLYAMGSFTTIGGVACARVAVWDGVRWTSLGGGVGGRALDVARFGAEIVVAGGFQTAGGATSNGIARWSTTGVPWIANQDGELVGASGSERSLSVVAAEGYGDLIYRWRRNGIPLSDRPASSNSAAILGSDSPTLTLTGVRVLDQGSYDCVVSNPCGQVISNPATLTVTHLCPPDCNGDGNLDCDDLADFINAYFADEPRPAFVDFNQDSESNGDDLADFINAYFLGCL